MTIGGPELPPQVLDLESQTTRTPPMGRRTRWVVYGALGLTALLVLGGLVWIFLPD